MERERIRGKETYQDKGKQKQKDGDPKVERQRDKKNN